MENRLPKIPHAFFKWYCRSERYEELHGDLEEFFYERIEKSGLRKAQFGYWIDVIRCCRPYAWRKLSSSRVFNNGSMFRNYFKISLRSLAKNPVSSFINVFGLAVAIGITLLVYSFMEYDYSIDQFHKNKNEVYLTTFFADRDGDTSQYGKTPRPLGEMLKADFKQIKSVCRVEDRRVVLKQGDNIFHEVVRFADPEFLQMFTFPLQWGDSRSLADQHSIILNHDMSVKYFGTENPVGREMLMVLNDTIKKVFTVAGVAERFPKSHDIEFQFLVNFENLVVTDPSYDKADWSEFVSATLLQLNTPDEIDAIRSGMDKYRKLQNLAAPDWKISSFAFEPLVTLHERVARIKDGIARDENVEGRMGMPIIAVFMIVLACLNYMNIAIVSAARRLKEIGIRKTIGANRLKIMVQFLTENIIVTCFALVTGIALCAFVFMPWFVNFSGWPLELKLLDQNVWIFVGVLVFFTGIASGIYPAVFISKFDAVKIFKGSQQFGRKNPFTKVFLGIQLVVACITMTCGVVFTQNHDYQTNRSWGYDEETGMYTAVPDQAAYEKLKAAMLRNPGVLSVSGSEDHIGRTSSRTLIHLGADRHYEVDQFAVDASYFETMGLQLSEGRIFQPYSENDRRAVVVNEYLVERLGLDHPIGTQLELDGLKYEIIGVLKEFHHRNFFQQINPTIFKLADEKDYRFLSLRVEQSSKENVHAALIKEWTSLYPDMPFQGGYQEDVWSGYFFYVGRSQTFTNVIACIAVLLASLGVYGLVALNVSGRMKEFSIRRTLGAGIGHIFSVIVRQYRLLTVTALIAGAPLSYWFAEAYLKMLFAYPMPIDYSGVAIAMGLLLIVLLAVISTQLKKVVTTNALTELKSE
ncbi:MAG TPA: ABC transporter permease [Cyclobacteriaceae bacterium]|nr:ABC transporter permease [Cyclobacteriaceae bacterium]